MIKLDENFKLMKKQVYEHMLNTRGDKYKWFLRALRSFKYLSLNPARGDFLEGYYTLMRYVDDVVDGDAPIPKSYTSPITFVEEKINFANDPNNPKDVADYLMLYCFEAASRFGEDFFEETHDILSSMLFDAKRIGKGIIFPEEELMYHFHSLDIKGTVKASLKVFGEDPNKYFALEPLGLVSRIYYNLRDYGGDIEAGLVNISAEDCDKFGISSKDLENELSIGVQRWFNAEAQKGMGLLKQHKQNLSETEFNLLTRITLPVVYERSANRFFEKILKV